MSALDINKIVYDSKPIEGERLERERASYDLLDQLQIPYRRIDHDATATIEDCNEVEAILEVDICKNLFLRNRTKTDFYLLVMPGRKKFITKEVSKQLEKSRLSFAEAEYMEEFLQISPGSVSILGLMNDTEHRVQLLIDKEVLESEYFGCHPCMNTSSLKVKTADILEKFLPFTGHEPIIMNL